MASDDHGSSLAWRSYSLGALFLLSSVLSFLVRSVSPMDHIGSGDPITSIFLLFIGMIFIRGGYLVHIEQEQGRGHVLTAWLAGLLITVVVSLVWISGIIGNIIMTGGPGNDPVDTTLLSVIVTGILSLILSRPYREILHGRARENEREDGRIC